MNVELLEQISQHALDFPKSVQMEQYAEPAEENPDHPCGTVACIAGHAVRIQNPTEFKQMQIDLVSDEYRNRVRAKRLFKDMSQTILGLTDDQAESLFFTDSWPEDFEYAWGEAMSDKEMAEVFAARIRHFIATEGRE